MTNPMSDEELQNLEEYVAGLVAPGNTPILIKADEAKGLIARLRAAEKNAARYVWLRDKCNLFEHYRSMSHRPDAFEREVDHAMEQQP